MSIPDDMSVVSGHTVQLNDEQQHRFASVHQFHQLSYGSAGGVENFDPKTIADGLPDLIALLLDDDVVCMDSFDYCNKRILLQEVVEKSAVMLFRVTKQFNDRRSIWASDVLNRSELVTALLRVIETHNEEQVIVLFELTTMSLSYH